jgi:hypothetical protein
MGSPDAYGDAELSAGASMPLFGMCPISERPAGDGPLTGMGKAAGSGTAREAEAIIVMLRWHLPFCIAQIAKEATYTPPGQLSGLTGSLV